MDGNGSGAMGGGIAAIFGLAIGIVMIASMWKVFAKAGQPGWACLVPIYNVVVLLKIVGKPIWWLILFMIPFVNFVIIIMVLIDLAKSFGKGAGFGIGLLLLGFVFFPILGFGSDRYLGLPGAPLPAAA